MRTENACRDTAHVLYTLTWVSSESAAAMAGEALAAGGRGSSRRFCVPTIDVVGDAGDPGAMI